MKERGTLTESMFYVLMSFLRGQMCGIEITEFVERKTNGRVRLGPGTLYTLLGKFQEEGLIRETEIQPRPHPPCRPCEGTRPGSPCFFRRLSAPPPFSRLPGPPILRFPDSTNPPFLTFPPARPGSIPHKSI